MGKEYFVRHGALAGAVGIANLVALNEAGVAEPLQVPAGATHITKVTTSLSASIVAVASAGVTVRIVLAGNGMVPAQQITVGGIKEDTTSTGGFHAVIPVERVVDFAVKAGNPVTINAFMLGVDPGTPELDVELCFE